MIPIRTSTVLGAVRDDAGDRSTKLAGGIRAGAQDFHPLVHAADTVQYTRSALHDKLNYLNPQNGVLEDRISPNDRLNRLSLGASIQLPFGREQRWGSNWNGVDDGILGGWQVSGTYQNQSGSTRIATTRATSSSGSG